MAVYLVLEFKYIFGCDVEFFYVFCICGNCYKVFCNFFFIVCGFQKL